MSVRIIVYKKKKKNYFTGEEWKKVRNVLNPSFTRGKVKLCSEIVSRCTEELVRVLKTHHEQSEAVDLLQVAQGYSLDAITKIAMAWKVSPTIIPRVKYAKIKYTTQILNNEKRYINMLVCIVLCLNTIFGLSKVVC